MTWFGHPGVTQVGKYRGKGMRLDYFWVDEALAARLEACEQATDDVPEKEMAERPDRALLRVGPLRRVHAPRATRRGKGGR